MINTIYRLEALGEGLIYTFSNMCAANTCLMDDVRPPRWCVTERRLGKVVHRQFLASWRDVSSTPLVKSQLCYPESVLSGFTDLNIYAFYFSQTFTVTGHLYVETKWSKSSSTG